MRAVLWILEDDENLGFLLEAALSCFPNVQIRLFTTGEEALMAKGVPDIIFADTQLAGRLTGPEVVESLRARYPDVAAVYSSSLGRPSHVKLGPRDRVLPKPFSVAALVNQVKLMISEIPRLAIPPTHHHHPNARPHAHSPNPHNHRHPRGPRNRH